MIATSTDQRKAAAETTPTANGILAMQLTVSSFAASAAVMAAARDAVDPPATTTSHSTVSLSRVAPDAARGRKSRTTRRNILEMYVDLMTCINNETEFERGCSSEILAVRAWLLCMHVHLICMKAIHAPRKCTVAHNPHRSLYIAQRDVHERNLFHEEASVQLANSHKLCVLAV